MEALIFKEAIFLAASFYLLLLSGLMGNSSSMLEDFSLNKSWRCLVGSILTFNKSRGEVRWKRWI
jgi:hypothetical protein